jgi:hypothetical protein
VLVLELALFSRSYLLADRSTLSVTRTAELIENNQNSDMVILGASRSLAVDARLLEDSLEDFDEIYNYSVPSLGTSAQFAMILQKYLDNNRKPEVLLLALGPESFGKFRIDELFFSLWSGEAIRLRRFFSVIDLLRYMPWKEKIFLVRDGKTETIKIKGQELYIGEVEDMADAITQGNAPRISLDDSRANVSTILALLESARTNKPVKIS